MKTMLLAATVFAAAVTTPALAQTRDQWRGPFAYEQDYSGYAYSNGANTPRRSMNRNLYGPRGDYRGTDPDPTVRDQLTRDPTQGD